MLGLNDVSNSLALFELTCTESENESAESHEQCATHAGQLCRGDMPGKASRIKQTVSHCSRHNLMFQAYLCSSVLQA